jgi:hypothetical protein
MVSMDAVIVSDVCDSGPAVAFVVQLYEGERRLPLRVLRDRLAGGKDDLVITPGGPRPREDVRRVQPGEVVRQNEDGTYTIVPTDKPAASQPKEPSKKE